MLWEKIAVGPPYISQQMADILRACAFSQLQFFPTWITHGVFWSPHPVLLAITLEMYPSSKPSFTKPVRPHVVGGALATVKQ